MALAKGSSAAGNLKIGDVVLLYYSAEQRVVTESAEKSGFILADLSGSGSQQLLTVRPAESSQHELPNMQFGTFKVLSCNKYEAQTRYRALLEKLNEFKRKKAGQSAIQLLQLQVTQAKRDGEVERAENAAKQRRLQGSNVYYGDSIQLLHTLTGKYVCVSTTDTSVTENTKLKVYLQRKDSVGCIFRLHPHIKVQTIGEEVNYDDQIKFESVATEGQYLHCSKKTFGDVNINAFSECYELNLAAKDSPLKIIHHYHPTTRRDLQVDSTLKASGVLRFFHRKHQCYIVGEGSFAGRYGHLPEMDEGQDSEANTTEHLIQSTLRRRSKSLVSVGSRSPIMRLKVRADVEPVIHERDEDFLQVPDVPSLEISHEGDGEGLLAPPSPVPSKHRRATLPEQLPSIRVRRQSIRLDMAQDDVISEDVHFQWKRRTGNLSSQTSTSPNTFWQIEKYKNPFSGEPMQWSEPCRIKHLPTRRYLAVTEIDHNYIVTLKSHKLPPSATIFELFPVVQQVGGEINYDSHVRVKHRDTGTWLHLNKELRYYSEQSDDIDDALDEVEEAGQLFEVIATKGINSDDAFTLEKVEDKLVADFNYIAGVTAVLANQLQQCELLGGKPHSPQECHMNPALSSLHYLQSLLLKSKEKQDIKNKQKLIRCMRTLVLVVRLLDLHRNENSNDPEVCTACFGVIINFLEGKSKKNKLYVSSMMKHIFTSSVKDTELIGNQTVEKALVGIAQDNPSVLYEETLMKRIIGYVMKKLQVMDKDSTKIIQLIEILTALCTCKGVPVKQNQLIIIEELQSIIKMGEVLLYPLRIKPNLESEGGLVTTDKDITVVINLEESSTPLIRKHSSSEGGQKGDRQIQFQALYHSEKASSTSTKGLRSGIWYPLSRGGKQFHKYLVAQLNLLVQMCRGDNTKVIQTLQGAPATQTIGMEIDFDLILSAIGDQVIKVSLPKLRASFVELLKVMYVEVGENRPYLEKFPLSFKINEVGKVPFESTTIGIDPEKAEITALTGMENPHFPTIRNWIRDFFQDKSEYFFAADENKRNLVVVKVLQLLASLVKFGYYDDTADIKALLPSIQKLLNGKEDFPTKESKDSALPFFKEEHHPSEQSGVKLTRFQRLSFRRNAKLSVRSVAGDPALQSYQWDDMQPDADAVKKDTSLAEFRAGERYQFNEERRYHFEIKYWALEVLNLLFNFELYKSLHNFIHDFRWLAQSKFHLQEEADEFELVAVKKPQKLKSELSTLITDNPRDPKFVRESPKLAKKIIASVKNRLKLITQRSDNLDLSDHQHLPKILLDLANYSHSDLLQHSLLLLDRYYTSQRDIFKQALRTQLLLTPQSIELYNTIEGLFIELFAFVRSGSGAAGAARDPSPIKLLTNHCWLEEEAEGFEPHQINQNIILSFGIFSDVLNIVVEYCHGQLFAAEEAYKKKLMDCLDFLRALACKNPDIQTRLLQHLESFIKATSGELGSQVGQLILEIFKGGPSITLSLKEEQLWKMMRLMFVRGKDTSQLTIATLMCTFHELLVVRELGLPLKHNQLIVVRFISLIRDDDRYWCKDLLAEGRAFLRWEILTGKSDSDAHLQNLLMITDLLATCAYGDNTGVDSVCCTIYSEEELVEIISSKEISLYRKRPFMKLLVWVYMNVHGDKADERSFFYRSNEELWDHMSKMAAAIQHMSETMKDMPHSAYLSVKELVASPSWKYLHDCPDRKHTHEPPKMGMEGENDYKEHFNISDLLLYISDAFFPFLQVYYGEYYRSDYYDQQHGNTTEATYRALLSLHPVLNCKRVYFSQEDQVKLYYRVLFLIKPYSACDLPEELKQTEESIESSEGVFQQEIVSEAREKYQARYEGERELNETFSQFVFNYRAAFEGRNTMRDQIIDTTVSKRKLSDKISYSDFLDEKMTKPGPKFLPLGRSFQEHVAIFNLTSSEDKETNPKDKLLKQLEISLSKRSEDISGDEQQTELDIKCLQILRASIHNQIILIDEEDKERNPKKYRRQCEQHLHPVQNEIQDLGNAVLRVMPLLSHSDERIVYEVLAFLEALLEFGNTHVQDGLKEIIQTREHQVFPTLKAILQRAAIVYRESQLLISLLKARVAFDKKIVLKIKMIENKEEDDPDEPDFSVLSLNRRSSSVQADGSLLVTGPRRKSLFRSRKKTKVVLVGDSRVPFMALYQHTETDADDIGERAHSILHFYDLSRISLISKVLGLMCDGQYREMQNYLRDQSEDINSVNMVAEIASFLYEFSKKQVFSVDTLKLFNQLLQALIEFCIGNYKNREVVFNANIISVINYVLQIDITKIKGAGRFSRNVSTTIISNVSDLDELGGQSDTVNLNINYVHLRKMALEMKASVVQLLDALLEEISNRSSTLSHQIAEGLDVTALHHSMLDFFILKSDPDLVRIEYGDNASRALFDSYKIIMHLVDNGFAPLDTLTPAEKSTLKAWNYCVEKSRSIEVVFKDDELKEDVLTRVHFNVNVESDIREQLRDTVKFQVDRSTHGDKLRDFHEWMVAIKKDTLHHEWLKKTHLSIVKLFSKTRYWLLLLVTLVLNIFFIIYYMPTINEESICPTIYSFVNGTVNPDLHTDYVISTFILGTLYAVLSFWMLLEYFVVTWPHFVLPKFLYSLKKIFQKLQRYRLLSWTSKIRLLPKINRTYSSVNIFGVKTLYLVVILLIAGSPLYCFGYLYCISFLYIIVNNDILQRALQSITKNWKSLLWVAILLVLIVYIFAVISFAVLRSEFQDEDNENVFCRTLDECFISVLRFGLIDSFLEIGVNDAHAARLRFFFDISFFIIVTTIGLNIVFGIIVDTFSELRDSKFTAEQDMKTTCFICGLPSHEFEKLGNNGFERHVKEDHNMWAYVYYSIYLDQIDVTNHNAIEKYVYEKIKSGNIDYIPFQKALVLEGSKEDKELKEELEQLQRAVHDTFNALSHRFDALEGLIQTRSDN